MIGALFGGIAIGFLLGALIAPAIRRASEKHFPAAQPSEKPGSTIFSGPLGEEGGGFDGEPLS